MLNDLMWCGFMNGVFSLLCSALLPWPGPVDYCCICKCIELHFHFSSVQPRLD